MSRPHHTYSRALSRYLVSATVTTRRSRDHDPDTGEPTDDRSTTFDIMISDPTRREEYFRAQGGDYEARGRFVSFVPKKQIDQIEAAGKIIKSGDLIEVDGTTYEVGDTEGVDDDHQDVWDLILTKVQE